MRHPLALAVSLGVVLTCASGARAVECGDLLVGPATFSLDADLACAADPALTLRDGAVLRLRGHTVRIDSVASAGVVVEGTGVRILDGTITSGSLSGVLLAADGSRHLVRDVHLTGHASASGAVGLRSAATSHRLRVVRSAADFTWDGIFPRGTAFDFDGEGHHLARNEASRAFTGFRLSGSAHRFTRNRAVGTAVGVQAGGTGHLLARTFATKGVDGIIVGGDGHRVVRNRVEQNVIGILAGSSNTLYRHNVALGNFPDLRDDSLDCGTNVWRRNRFETVESFGDCIE